jgi:hypothetical protein
MLICASLKVCLPTKLQEIYAFLTGGLRIHREVSVLLGGAFPAAPASSIDRISGVVVVEMGAGVLDLSAWFEE